MAKQTAKTSQQTSATKLRKPKHGKGLLVVGRHGGNQGGRPKDELQQKYRAMVSDDERIALLDNILRNADHKLFAWAYETALEHGYGKPTQAVEHSGEIVHRVEYTDEDTGE